jgi:copper(I)-binding protein
MRYRILVPILFLLVSGCASQQSGKPVPAEATRTASAEVANVSVQGAFIAKPVTGSYPAGSTTSVQMTLLNSGTEWDTLTGASSPAASGTTLMRLTSEQDTISVPTDHEDVQVFCQLHGLVQDLKSGERVALTLKFTLAGSVTVDVPVQ